MTDHSKTTVDRLKAAEDFVRDELRIMGQTEDEALIKRVAVTIAKRMERVQTDEPILEAVVPNWRSQQFRDGVFVGAAIPIFLWVVIHG